MMTARWVALCERLDSARLMFQDPGQLRHWQGAKLKGKLSCLLEVEQELGRDSESNLKYLHSTLREASVGQRREGTQIMHSKHDLSPGDLHHQQCCLIKCLIPTYLHLHLLRIKSQ